MEKCSLILSQILYGGTLKDKLSGAHLLLNEIEWDLQPRAELPDLPGREGGLRPLTDSHDANQKVRFPKKSELKNLSSRGMLLHFFANHELLAIETMAYTLLRFPDAPLDFKKGVMKTLQDEQRHLGLYVERMHEYGVELGQVPLNLYFWNILKTMKSPIDFVARMSLTFEQANLDFALEYAELFKREIDDPQTAALLTQVHDDEVKHVGHGLKWLKEWKGAGETEWEAYQNLLPFPLTPRRAKGAHYFSVASREQAGLSADFIQHLKIAGGSRGRVPDYFYFNPQCEMESQMSELPNALKEKSQDLAPLMLWLAQEDDVVELPEEPNLGWLTQLHEWRRELPEIILEGSSIERYAAFEALRPWGWGAGAWKKWNALRSKLRKTPSFTPEFHPDRAFCKSWWKSRLQTPGFVIDLKGLEIETVANRLKIWFETLPKGTDLLLKASSSTSGRGHVRVSHDDFQELSGVHVWLQKNQGRLKKHQGAVLEPFYAKEADFSVQYEILPEGSVKSFEPRLFFIDEHFQYLGSILGTPHSGEWKNVWHEVQKNQELICLEHEKVLSLLKRESYVGPLGIDALLHRVGPSLKVQAVIEVNVRLTMGRVAHEIEKVLKTKMGKEAGIWLMVNRAQLLKFGFLSFEKWKESLELKYGKNKVFATSPWSKKEGQEVETWTVAVLGNQALQELGVKR